MVCSGSYQVHVGLKCLLFLHQKMVRSSMPLQLGQNLQPRYSFSHFRSKAQTNWIDDNNVPRRRKLRPRWSSTIPTVVLGPDANRHHDDGSSSSVHLFAVSWHLPRQIGTSKRLTHLCSWLIVHLTNCRSSSDLSFVFLGWVEEK